MDYANTTNVEFIVDPKVLFHGWLIYSYLQIFKLIKCKWLPGECADWFFDNIMTWSYCLHRRYSMSRQKNSILTNEHPLHREPVLLKVPITEKLLPVAPAPWCITAFHGTFLYCTCTIARWNLRIPTFVLSWNPYQMIFFFLFWNLCRALLA